MPFFPSPWHRRLLPLVLAMACLSLSACTGEEETVWQGYVEGEFVHVAAPLGGELLELSVDRGDTVDAGDPLFRLEREYERAALAEAREGLRRAENNLANLKKGRRPSELRAIEAQLRKARSNVELARVEFERRKTLLKERTISEEEYDRARTQYQNALQQVREIQAQLTTAKLGAREDEVKAAEAEVSAARSRLEQARWNYDQKTQAAPVRAMVFDTIRKKGEFVPAAGAVVSLLPPDSHIIRFFVPEPQVGGVQPGDRVLVSWDGQDSPVPAAVSYVSPQAEYTPPVIYSSKTRAKLVFLLEARPERPQDAALLKPGQPVDVRPADGHSLPASSQSYRQPEAGSAQALRQAPPTGGDVAAAALRPAAARQKNLSLAGLHTAECVRLSTAPDHGQARRTLLTVAGRARG